MCAEIKGRVNSIQTLGTVDGPGVRFVVFLQGCNLRCGCCHNPETWGVDGGTEYTARELAQKAELYREYFGAEGGITLSGGEPLLQAKFAAELFAECKEKGINTCLDTSGSIWNDDVCSLLELTDIVLLDIKYTNDSDYREYAGCSIEAPLRFLEYLKQKNIPTVLRQVIIPTLNDRDDNILKLKQISENHPNIIKTELLPFKKLCSVKYERLNLSFKFGHLPTPTAEQMDKLNSILNGGCKA